MRGPVSYAVDGFAAKRTRPLTNQLVEAVDIIRSRNI